ncbi:putative aminopeptidase NPEPL1 [Phytophthora ramorum]|uniref:putative aminopeptidase NPEPL1 n=1 Tax=Phytophthora ramorum TaxID=164328 RepID=UPI0030AA80D6|nr:putative aminopeptidase NPEPL1 [Phytophthora ramorum]
MINMDAGGHLVLADGVAHAPKVTVCRWHRICAIYTSDGELETLVAKAGKVSGERVHPMPYAPELHRLEFKSTVADMKNADMNRANGQVSCAGYFIVKHR